MERLGKNHDGYHGERIDVRAVLRDIVALAPLGGWIVDELPVMGGDPLLALRRVVPGAKRSIYLSAGIHGDEPAGPLAVRELVRENHWPANADLCLCPCLNPWGLVHNSRTNATGIDLNRDYRHLETAEVRAHVAWLQKQSRFDRTICLHEDWEAQGFYVYELCGEGRPWLAPSVVAAAAALGPIDRSAEIDGRPARDGMIHPSTDIAARPQWPEALYLFAQHTAQALTLEAASDFPLPQRVATLVAATHAVLAAD